MSNLELKKPYIHYKNKKTYMPEFLCTIQIDNEWVAAVGYIEMYVETHHPYIRTIDEFNQKFKKDFS